MKVSIAWLKQFIPITIDTKTLVNKLTMGGIETAHITPAAQFFSNVIIGEIKSIDAHPNADKLRICKINTGSELLTIVCGAKNIAENQRVPVALIGAVLPNNFKIEKAKLRGIESFGMICSPKELGIEEPSDGIWILPNDAPIGELLWDYLQFNDEIITLELTPNRGDCASMRGIAREIAALCGINYTDPVTQINAIQTQDLINTTLAIKNHVPESCPRYLGRIIQNINMKTSLPFFMRDRLRRAGINNINAIVDILNYIMLELGQPMHAFDLAKINKEIQIRYARPNEKLRLLNQEEINLTENVLLIAGDQKPLAIAGVMGGSESAVSGDTQSIFLESAFFTPQVIAHGAKLYNLTTDASYRFERGVDVELPRIALDYATQLILKYLGGEAGVVTEVTANEHLPKSHPIELCHERITQLLGFSIEPARIEKILKSLGMPLISANSHWIISSPSWRFDLAIEEDLIEEIARIVGYDFIPNIPYLSSMQLPSLNSFPTEHYRNTRTLLCQLGYAEVVSYSFMANTSQLSEESSPKKPILLANPLTSELNAMRMSIIPNLLNILAYNLNRQESRVKIFEIGPLFYCDDQNNIQQALSVSGLTYGDRYPEQWGQSKIAADFFDVKLDIEKLLKKLFPAAIFTFKPSEELFLHPHQSATIFANNEKIGVIGALSPEILKKYDLPKTAYVFEVLLPGIASDNKVLLNNVRAEECRSNRQPRNQCYVSCQPHIYRPLSKFPAIKRDLAFVLDKNISAEDFQQAIVNASGELLTEITFFDVYEGDRLPPHKKSLALHLTFQALNRTLLDKEICDLIDFIVESLRFNFQAELRS